MSRFVLMEIADDYENLKHINSLVARHSRLCGLSITRREIMQALADLIEARLAKAYRLSGAAPVREIQGVPSLSEMRYFHTHFWATPEGQNLVVSDRDWWPFDDVGALRTDWTPPWN